MFSAARKPVRYGVVHVVVAEHAAPSDDLQVREASDEFLHHPQCLAVVTLVDGVGVAYASTKLSTTSCLCARPSYSSSRMASSTAPASERFQVSSPSVQKYSRPRPVFGGRPPWQGSSSCSWISCLL
jgi:hypothetical protein